MPLANSRKFRTPVRPVEFYPTEAAPPGDEVVPTVVLALAILLALAALWWLAGHPGLTLFEDGSWITPGGLNGCLPWAICNL